MKQSVLYILVGFIAAFSIKAKGQNQNVHPNLLLTENAVSEIVKNKDAFPLLIKSFDNLKEIIDNKINEDLVVPVPRDPAGGFTHTQHKENYMAMHGAGVLWQLTGEESYARYVRDMLLEYSQLYPSLGEHPVKASYAPGRLFWQSLNEAVWLVYSIQAYDCVYDFLISEDREKIERNLLRPYVDFLSIETPKVFNKIHNHGVWAVAAVGMTGIVLDDEDLINRALYGVNGNSPKDKDSREAGFFVQLDMLFSPDGYYTEGPYYQRYAMFPYLLFAQSLDNYDQEVNIFAYRDSILKKAVVTTLELTNTDGRFFPINDALKNMSYTAPELVHAVGIIYNIDDSRKDLLSIAEEQDRVIFSEGGLNVARDIHNKETKPFIRPSREYKDGKNGEQGAVGVLRSSDSETYQTLVMKYPSLGMGHGHFDRLSYIFYDHGNEIFTDYGAARFVNIEYKDGGRYLPENKTWAKQTIAHNTLVANQRSHFNGKVDEASKHHAESWFFDAEGEGIKIMSGKESNAYPDIELHRTLALIEDEQLLNNPVVLDVFRIKSSAKEDNTLDLPFHYNGHIMHTEFDYSKQLDVLNVLGQDNGYQHLWNEGQAFLPESTNKIVFLKDKRFYSVNFENFSGDSLMFSSLGANDPNFNLRKESSFILRRHINGGTVLLSSIESHGERNYDTEMVYNMKGSVEELNTVLSNDEYTVVEIVLSNQAKMYLSIANQNADVSQDHQIEFDGLKMNWEGPYNLLKVKE